MTQEVRIPTRPAVRARRRLNGTLIAGLVLSGVVVAVAAFGPLLLVSPLEQNVEATLAPPSAEFLLGTDQLGRDLLSRIVSGMRVDLLIATAALILPMILGGVLGAVSAWRGGWLDSVTGVLADVVQAFPYYLLIIVLVFFLGAGVGSIFIAVGAIAWVSYLRILRAQVQAAKDEDYAKAALGAGYSGARVLLRHILPNVYKQPLTFYVTDVVVVIISTATLSYFGLGIAPPTPELGAIIADGQQFIAERPLLSVAPGLAVVLIGVALSLLGNGLSEQADES